MAAPAQSLIQPAFEAPADAAPAHRLARLARIHIEAVETARLANLLGRALYATVALGVLAGLVLTLAGSLAAPALAWAALIGAAVFAMAIAYRRAIARPFERATLHAFAQDMSACLLYAGFAWGAGAFLALPETTPALAALLFAAVPAAAFAALLRARQAALLFLAPVAALTSLACVMRPFGDGAPAAAVVLVACTILAWAIHAMTRSEAKDAGVNLSHGLIAS